jgi:predicted phosphodiesterase
LTRRFLSFFLLASFSLAAQSSPDFRFAIVGDRAGGPTQAAFEAVWRAVRAWQPAFVVTAGDWIEGGDDRLAEREWRALEKFASGLPVYFVAGNHDIWSGHSRRLYERFTRRPARYSFTHQGAQFIVLDNAMSADLPTVELDFLESELRKPATGPRFVLFHQPSWILPVLLRQTDFRLHQLAKQYGVTAIISGHTHAYLRKELEGVTYLTVCSAGGYLRGRDPLGRGFAEGYFYGYTQVTVANGKVEIVTQELGKPLGRARRVYAEK